MSGTMTAVATLGAVSAMLAGGIAAGQAATATQRAAGAADAAALAAADALSGAVDGAPCDVAATLAERNGARLDDCVLDGMTATVSVSASTLGLPVVARARAGTPLTGGTGPDGRDERNGELSSASLAAVSWRSDLLLRADAAAALEALNTAFRGDTGGDLPLSDAYRDLDGQIEQRALWCARGACEFAAEPGTSNHGWGTAIDVRIGRTDWDAPVYRWLSANAGRFGWTHPAWADPGGATPEAWHWEYGG